MKASQIVELITVMYQLEGDRTSKGMIVCAELERIKEEAVMAFMMCCPRSFLEWLKESVMIVKSG